MHTSIYCRVITGNAQLWSNTRTHICQYITKVSRRKNCETIYQKTKWWPSFILCFAISTSTLYSINHPEVQLEWKVYDHFDHPKKHKNCLCVAQKLNCLNFFFCYFTNYYNFLVSNYNCSTNNKYFKILGISTNCLLL